MDAFVDAELQRCAKAGRAAVDDERRRMDAFIDPEVRRRAKAG